jgi:hypothetical protein
MGISPSSKAIDTYFELLVRLGDEAKKKLVIKLTESIGIEPAQENNLQNLFGA